MQRHGGQCRSLCRRKFGLLTCVRRAMGSVLPGGQSALDGLCWSIRSCSRRWRTEHISSLQGSTCCGSQSYTCVGCVQSRDGQNADAGSSLPRNSGKVARIDRCVILDLKPIQLGDGAGVQRAWGYPCRERSVSEFGKIGREATASEG